MRVRTLTPWFRAHVEAVVSRLGLLGCILIGCNGRVGHVSTQCRFVIRDAKTENCGNQRYH